MNKKIVAGGVIVVAAVAGGIGYGVTHGESAVCITYDEYV